MFIELHIVQNFAPSNLNRDDLGQPKDCDFGGSRRARISSQCQKRVIRLDPDFKKATGVEPAKRTKLIVRGLVKKLLSASISEEDAKTISIIFANAYSGKMDQKKKEETAVLLYMSESEFDWISQALQTKKNSLLEFAKAMDNIQGTDEAAKKKRAKIKSDIDSEISAVIDTLVKETKNRTNAPDIAMFGRMLADRPETNIDAACQVAHAISTHSIDKMELDYYTAMDDLKDKHETGAGFLDVAYFNSACFYRYARIDWNQLLTNLGNDKEFAKKTVEGFLRAALHAVPTGKQNSFAAQNKPDFVLGVVRTDGESWSLANAFEKPIKADRDGGYLAGSISAMDSYWGRLNKIYGGKGINPTVLALDENAPVENLKKSLAENREMWVKTILAGLE